jgi:hypothetical protein
MIFPTRAYLSEKKQKTMISVTGVTNNYSLQPALLEKHSRTLAWLSLSMHWKSELGFFQKILKEIKPSITSPEARTEIENFENQIFYFLLDGIEELRRKLRNHESRLAKMLEARSEWDTQYYKEHDALMESAAELSKDIEQLVAHLKSLYLEHPRN